jgi:hypothetical protein
MAQITGWGRGTWGQLTFGEPLPVSITGVTSGTTSVGSLVATGDANVAETGVNATGAVGTTTATGVALVGVTGNAGTGAIGQESATGTAEVAVTNVVGTTALGTEGLITNNVLPITLGAATGSVGSVTTAAAATAYPTNVLATTALGGLTVWGEIVPGVTTNWSVVSDSQSPNWQEVA